MLELGEVWVLASYKAVMAMGIVLGSLQLEAVLVTEFEVVLVVSGCNGCGYYYYGTYYYDY